MKQRVLSSFYIAVPMTVLALLSLQLGFAQVASSTNYQLQSDSLNFGGGFSSSTNYSQESTFGEIGTGRASSTNYQLRAGYQQMQEVYIAISAVADVTMSPSLGGLTGGTSNGSTSVTVTTDNPAGYYLTYEASTSPAMQSPLDTIDDYDEGVDADFSFAVVANEARFGFSPSGSDITTAFKDNGALCGGGGTLDTALACWAGLATTPITIAQSSSANHPSGTETELYFRVGVGSGAGILDGLYTATTTLTALPL
jgi:hypothetical protein